MIQQQNDSGFTGSIYRRDDGKLIYKSDAADAAETPVTAVSAFPWSRPFAYISLRDEKGRELFLLKSIDDMPEASRSLIEECILQRNFIPRITLITSITAEIELFHWRVETTSGSRSILTNKYDQPRTLPNGSVLIKDVGNDVYLIDDPKKLDAKSAKLLWVYLD